MYKSFGTLEERSTENQILQNTYSTMPSTLDFKCAIVTGGGGGIGRAISEYLLKQGKKVIIVGRTESRLQSTAKEIGATAHYVLDTGSISSIPAFVKKLTSEHPEIDCLINNAGIQRPLEVNKLSAVEFGEKADQEIDVNIRGPMHLILNFLPHLKTKSSATIMNISSTLGFIPISIINPVYNGTKAWLHMFTTNLRTQLQSDKETRHIKVVEIAPPTVATDLHREREDPDDNKKEKNDAALSVDEFMEHVVKGWEEGLDLIGAGMSIAVVKKWEDVFGTNYEKVAKGYVGK
jgi:short-subunit dehydrogenase involved in D-alanine esterification of teichoic acids